MDKILKIRLEFLANLGPNVTGDSKELIEQEFNNMLYKLGKKWNFKDFQILELDCKEL